MKLNEAKLEPIMVKNPDTGRLINVAPLFDLVNEHHQGEFFQLSDSIDDAAVFIASSGADLMRDNPEGCAGTLYELFCLRNAVKSMSEYKEERRS